MAPDVEHSVKNTSKSKLLTMDVIELTLLLKSIGFRLESIDYDEFRNWGKKMSTDCIGNGIGASATTTTTKTNSIRSDAEHHYINVEISCSKSKIVSNLSFKINESDAAATDAQAPTMADSTKLMTCTCPKREPRIANNSFWEVQSSGTFANQRRSINALMNGETGIDNDTSSNLLPTLSIKSITLTHVLTQVLLNQYKNNTPFGESIAKDIDIKSIMRTVEQANTISTTASEKVGNLPSVSQVEDLNLITPLSSMNVTPSEQEAIMNVTIPKGTINDKTGDDFVGRNTVLNETVNTEAFSSPKSELVTSSPHAFSLSNDAGIINHLKQARQSIDQALMSMKLNVTRNLSHEVSVSLLTSRQESPATTNHRPNRSIALVARKTINDHNISQIVANVRPPISQLSRRASLGSIGKMPPRSVASPAITSRFNAAKSNGVERLTTPVVAGSSKVSLVRRGVSGIANRTGNTIASTAKPSTLLTQSTASIKRPTLGARRTSSPAVIPSISTPFNGLITRKTAATTKLTSLPSKLAKK